MNKKRLIKEFGGEWFYLLEPFLNQEFKDIMKTLVSLTKNNKVIIPTRESKLLFKIFRNLQPKDIKIVFLGIEPYNNFINSKITTYDGYAFSNGHNPPWVKTSTSLSIILQEMERTEIKGNLNLDRQDFTYLVKQGLFLVNSSLSVESNIPHSHIVLWENFTRYWIKALSLEYPEIVWIIPGKYLKKFIINIQNTNILEVPYPLNTENSDSFIGSDIFKKCNELLDNINKQQIKF